MSSYSPIRAGREIWHSGQRLERHRHDRAYVALVLSGAYEEFGNRGCLRVADLDAVARTAERDPYAALMLLREQLQPLEPAPADWTEALARHLLADPQCCLSRWAREQGLRPETVARGFRKVFGVAPARFRAEGRAHRAFEMIVRAEAPLAEVAATTGFADQAHVTRAVRALTGYSPGAWRMSNPFNTAGARAG